jgi:CO/xanthine dehydrogenase Mo-binding subunit
VNGNFQHNLDRADTPAKCSDAARYVRDLRVPNMLEALTVRSTVRRAVITEISIPELPTGYSCVRPEDGLSPLIITNAVNIA